MTAKGAVIGEPLKGYHGIITGVPDLRLAPAPGSHVGLTPQESAALETLVRLGSAPREALATRIGIPIAELHITLERLVSLGYVALTDDGGSTYRAVARSGG